MKPSGRVGVIALVLGLVAVALAVRWLRPASEVYELVGATMGTSFSVRIDAETSAADRARVHALVEERLDALSRIMSTYDSTSELSRFNRRSSTEPFPASPELVEVLELAREVAERSGGALDVTVAPLVEAWGFGPASRLDVLDGPTPSDAELARLRPPVGYENIVVDPAAGTIAKTHADTRVDLSAIAKGYGVEAVSAALRAHGFESFLVEIGGELAATGSRRSGEPWRVGIERPDDGTPGIWGSVALVDEAIATSGDYRDYYERGGVRYAHIIDPRTGRPITSRGASVTVVHASAAMADAWATALTVLGPDEGYELARREGLAALFIRGVDGTLQSRSTPAFGSRIAGVTPTR